MKYNINRFHDFLVQCVYNRDKSDPNPLYIQVPVGRYIQLYRCFSFSLSDVHISANFCEEIITKSKTVSKGLLHLVQMDAKTVSAFVGRNILTVEEGDLLQRETSPLSDRLNDILRPALIRGGNSALQRFYWCLRDTQDDGRLEHKQLADAIKKRGTEYNAFLDTYVHTTILGLSYSICLT